jgi:hypothetical protein
MRGIRTPDVYAEMVVFAERQASSIAHVVEIAIVKYLRARGVALPLLAWEDEPPSPTRSKRARGTASST